MLYALAKKWLICTIAVLVVAVLASKTSYMTDMFFLLWMMTGVVVIYRSRMMEPERLQKWVKSALIVLGLLSCVMSFVNIPLGIGRSPYSLDDFSLLVAGISLIAFTLLDASPLIPPITIPIVVVLGYQLFGSAPSLWFKPLVAPTVSLLMVFLNAVGLSPSVDGTILSYLTSRGQPVRISIVADCTGIWSLIAYGVSVIMVLVLLPRIKSKGYLLIAAGFPITYILNLLRVTLILLAVYYLDVSWLETLHMHMGWVIFSMWMILFWYVFFSMRLYEKRKK